MPSSHTPDPRQYRPTLTILLAIGLVWVAGALAPSPLVAQARTEDTARLNRLATFIAAYSRAPSRADSLRASDSLVAVVGELDSVLRGADGTVANSEYYEAMLRAYRTLGRPAQATDIKARFVRAFTPAAGARWKQYLGQGHPSSPESSELFEAIHRRYPKDVGVLTAAFRDALVVGGGLTIAGPSRTPTSNDRAWIAMARVGRALVHACGPPPRTPQRGRDAPAADSATRTLCAQLLTAYIATRQAARVDHLVTTLEAHYHLAGERELQEWYAQQLLQWFGSDTAALTVVNAVLQRSSEAVTLHRALLLRTARILARSSSGATVYASLPRPVVWPSTPPPDNPFEQSTTISGIEFSGTFANYGRADWWYPSWGADDVLYTVYAGGDLDDSAGNQVSAPGWTRIGHALIRGADPLHLDLTPLAVGEVSPAPYMALFPSANLMHRGVWYVGTYAISMAGGCADFCILGPMVGFHWSTDKGNTWHAPPPTVTPAHPVFGEAVTAPEQIAHGARVKLSAAHFVDFGKDMRDSPDGKAYLIGHGAIAQDSRSNWASGDQIYLARVTPSPETINDVNAWEFYAGPDARGRPHWSKHFADIQPLLEWKDHLGNVTVTYDAPLKKYLLFTTHQSTPTLLDPFDLVVMEADRLTGPWRLVSYLKAFGPQAYSVNVPSKFVSTDGCTMWLLYTGNFAPAYTGVQIPGNPFGSGFWMNLHRIRLLGPHGCRVH